MTNPPVPPNPADISTALPRELNPSQLANRKALSFRVLQPLVRAVQMKVGREVRQRGTARCTRG